MKMKGDYFRYYGSPDLMKLVEVDEFNRMVVFKLKGEQISIPFALTCFIEEYNDE
jgi:hypothetical protein